MSKRRLNHHEQRRIAEAGCEARAVGKSEDACPYGNCEIQERCLWLAGYRDADNEIRNQRIDHTLRTRDQLC